MIERVQLSLNTAAVDFQLASNLDTVIIFPPGGGMYNRSHFANAKPADGEICRSSFSCSTADRKSPINVVIAAAAIGGLAA